MAHIFRQNPDAVIASDKIRYHGLQMFLERAEEVGLKNVGSLSYPQYYSSLCTCTRSNWTRPNGKPGFELGAPDFLRLAENRQGEPVESHSGFDSETK